MIVKGKILTHFTVKVKRQLGKTLGISQNPIEIVIRNFLDLNEHWVWPPDHIHIFFCATLSDREKIAKKARKKLYTRRYDDGNEDEAKERQKNV